MANNQVDSKELVSVLNDVIDFVDEHTIKAFAHQVMRNNQCNMEFKMVRRGFDFYAGYHGNTLRCQFNTTGEVFEFDVSNHSAEEALTYFEISLRKYMISQSIWKESK